MRLATPARLRRAPRGRSWSSWASIGQVFDDRLVPRLAGRGPRPDGRAAAQVVQLPAQAAIIAMVILFMFVEIGQLVGRLIRFLVRQLNRVAPPRVSFVVVARARARVTIAILNGVVIKVRDEPLNKYLRRGQQRDGPEQSGADHPAALRRPAARWWLEHAWPSGPHLRSRRPHRRAADDVQRHPRDGTDPRLRRARTPPTASGQRPNWPPAELERTGGLERKVIAVATTTGTGWINEAEASALEYMYNGDSAIVSACSTRSCRAGCRSWWTRRTPGRPGRRCSRRSTSGCGRSRRRSGPRSSCSARAWARSAARRRS